MTDLTPFHPFGRFDDSVIDDDIHDMDDGMQPGFDLPPVLSDPNERRLTMRVLQIWAGLRFDAECPHVGDVTPERLGPAAANCVFIRVHADGGLELVWTGENLRGEAGLPPGPGPIAVADVPAESMLGSLVVQGSACIDLRAPLDIESESRSIRGCEILYRGTLLPLGYIDGSIGGLLGAISWKECAPAGMTEELLAALQEVRRPPSR